MVSPAKALQDALGPYLAEHASVIAEFGVDPVRILSVRPNRLAFPYVLIGEDDVKDASHRCATVWDVAVRMHVFTREDGYLRVKRLSSVIASSLFVGPSGARPPLTVQGYSLVRSTFIRERFLDDPVKNVRHGVLHYGLHLQAI